MQRRTMKHCENLIFTLVTNENEQTNLLLTYSEEYALFKRGDIIFYNIFLKSLLLTKAAFIKYAVKTVMFVKYNFNLK